MLVILNSASIADADNSVRKFHNRVSFRRTPRRGKSNSLRQNPETRADDSAISERRVSSRLAVRRNGSNYHAAIPSCPLDVDARASSRDASSLHHRVVRFECFRFAKDDASSPDGVNNKAPPSSIPERRPE